MKLGNFDFQHHSDFIGRVPTLVDQFGGISQADAAEVFTSGRCMVEVEQPDAHWANISFGALAENAEMITGAVSAAGAGREGEDGLSGSSLELFEAVLLGFWWGWVGKDREAKHSLKHRKNKRERQREREREREREWCVVCGVWCVVCGVTLRRLLT